MITPSLSNFNSIISSSSNSTTSTSSSSTSSSTSLSTDLTVIAKINLVHGSVFPIEPYQGLGEDSQGEYSSPAAGDDRGTIGIIKNPRDPQKPYMTLILEKRNEDTQKLMQEMVKTIGWDHLWHSSRDPLNRPNEGIAEFHITPKQGLLTIHKKMIEIMPCMFGGCYFPERETAFVIEGMRKSWTKVSGADAQIKKIDEIIDEAISPQLPRVIINIIAGYDNPALFLLKKITSL